MTNKCFDDLILPKLADPHYHAREGKEVGPLLQAAVDGGSHLVGLMPNTAKGLLTAEQVADYMTHSQKVGPDKTDLLLLPYLQLTEKTSKGDIDKCVEAGILDAKVYPLNRTTKSQNGVRYYYNVLDVITYAGHKGMRIHFHPEHPYMIFENRDAEYQFLSIMDQIMNLTKGVVVWEHGTDARCIPFWKDWAATGRFYVTLTAHHLATSENETFGDTQATCKPPIKTRGDMTGLQELVAEGHDWVMAGSDSAAHDIGKKQVLGPCACGAFTAPFLLSLYAHALRPMLFLSEGREAFINFTSGNAMKLYGCSHDEWPHVTLRDEEVTIPESYEIGSWVVQPFWGGQKIRGSVTSK